MLDKDELASVVSDVDEIYIGVKDRVAVALAVAVGCGMKECYQRPYQATSIIDPYYRSITINTGEGLSGKTVQEVRRLLRADEELAVLFSLNAGWKIGKVEQVTNNGAHDELSITWTLARYIDETS